MFTNNKKKNICTKRVFIFILWNFLLITVIVFRLFYLQVYQSEKYKLLSDKNRLVIKQVLPVRGKILDNKGKEIAYNVYSYTIILDLLSINKDELQIFKNNLKKLDIYESAIQKLNNL